MQRAWFNSTEITISIWTLQSRWLNALQQATKLNWQKRAEAAPALHQAPTSFFFIGQRTNSLVSPFTPPFRSRPPKYSKGVWEGAVSSPSGTWDEAAADKRFGAYWSQKVQLWWQQFLLIFLRTNVIFCTRLISYGGSKSAQGGALWAGFLPEQSPPLPYGLRKSAPEIDITTDRQTCREFRIWRVRVWTEFIDGSTVNVVEQMHSRRSRVYT